MEDTTVRTTSLLTIVAFRGECDLREKRRITGRLNQAAAAEHLIIDFSETTYIDSTILAAVMSLVRARRQGHAHMPLIVASNPFIKKIFSIAGMDAKLEIVQTAREATRKIFQTHLAVLSLEELKAPWPRASSA